MRPREILQVVVSIMLALFVVLAPTKDTVALLTLGIAPMLILPVIFSEFHPRISTLPVVYLQVFAVLAALLPVLGMFTASLGAFFSLPIPFGFYFVLATLVTIHGYLALNLVFDLQRSIAETE